MRAIPAILGFTALALTSPISSAHAATQDFLLLSDCVSCINEFGVSDYVTTPLGAGVYQITSAGGLIGGGTYIATPLWNGFGPYTGSNAPDGLIYYPPSPNVFDSRGITYQNSPASGVGPSYDIVDTCAGTTCTLHIYQINGDSLSLVRVATVYHSLSALQAITVGQGTTHNFPSVGSTYAFTFTVPADSMQYLDVSLAGLPGANSLTAAFCSSQSCAFSPVTIGTSGGSIPFGPGTWYVNFSLNGATDPLAGFELTNTPVTLPAPTPLPTTWTMMLIGFAGLGLLGYRQSRKVAVPT